MSPYRLFRFVFSTAPPVPRNGVAVRPISTMPSSDISFLRLSQLKCILRRTSEYDLAVEWCASSITMHDVSLARLSSCPGSFLSTLSSDCIVATMTALSSRRSLISMGGRRPACPQNRWRRSVVPLLPSALNTSLKLLTACSHSSSVCATHTMNFDLACCSLRDGLPSLSHSMSVSTIMRVLPEPVGTAMSRRLIGRPPPLSSISLPSSMPRTRRPAVYW